MDTAITRAEHEEFIRRMDTENKRQADENDRQNKRIEVLENNMNQVVIQQLTALTTTIEKVNLSMSNMLREQAEFGRRLERLEGRDGEKWRQVMGYALTAAIGIVLGFLFRQIGL